LKSAGQGSLLAGPAIGQQASRAFDGYCWQQVAAHWVPLFSLLPVSDVRMPVRKCFAREKLLCLQTAHSRRCAPASAGSAGCTGSGSLFVKSIFRTCPLQGKTGTSDRCSCANSRGHRVVHFADKVQESQDRQGNGTKRADKMLWRYSVD